MKARTSGSGRTGCEAVQYSDQMQCARCGLAYDVNDPDPPECLQQETAAPTEMPPFGVYPAGSFMRELETLINSHSIEGGSNTPDFVLAQYLKGCLENFDMCVRRRDEWYSNSKEA